MTRSVVTRSAWVQLWRCRSREGAVALALLLVFSAAQAATLRPWTLSERVLSVDCADASSPAISPQPYQRHARVRTKPAAVGVVRGALRQRRPIEGRPAPRAPDAAA